jgi:CRP-like cAMP-binding protein
MEARHDPGDSSVSWMARLAEVLQPASARAERLAAMELFGGLSWSDLEFVAALVDEADIVRGTRMTVQGQPNITLALITQGEALVSADARPIRVAGPGAAVGVASMLHGTRSLETTIALTPIRALSAGPAQFADLVARPSIRLRLTAAAGDQLRERRALLAASLTGRPGSRATRRSRPQG